jgi:tetratricopeptide (TPR) repeat protein
MNPNTLIAQARAAVGSGQIDRAEKILSDLTKQHPKFAEAWVGLGTIQAQRGAPDEALESFTRALRVQPKNVGAQFGAGILLTHRAHYAEAIPLLQQALESLSTSLPALSALAQCYVSLHQPVKALACLDRALAVSPKDSDLMFARAACLRTLMRDCEAETCLKTALRIKPRPGGFASLGEIQNMFGRSIEAIGSARKSLEIDPKNHSAWIVAAKALLAQGEIEEAEECWTKARATAGDLAAFGLTKGNAYLRIGRFEEARQEFEESIALNPRQGDAYFSLVSSRKLLSSDAHILNQIQSAIADPETVEKEKISLYYALGKSYNDLAEFEEALTAYDRANELKKRLFLGERPFDPIAFTRGIDAKIEMIDRRAIEALTCDDSSSELPIFVLGMMRTGTTLLEQVLTRHPRIGGAGEQSFWPDHEHQLLPQANKSIKVQNLPALVSEYVNLLKKIAPGFDRVTDKNPANGLIAGILAIAFPHGKIIQTVRNPVDTALSIWMTPMSSNAEFICDRSNIVYALTEYRRLADHWRQSIPSDRFREISYEEVTADPKTAISEILEFCGVDWNDRCLETSQSSTAIRSPSFCQARQPINRDSTEKGPRYGPWLGEFEKLLT